MDKPTVEVLLRRIEKRAMRPEWFDPDVLFQVFRDDSHLWYRHPDSETIIKVTVEELPRSEWPNFAE